MHVARDVLLIKKQTVTVSTFCRVVAAHCGDSRAVLGTIENDGSVDATQLTWDHKPNVLSERSRIVAAGGKVVPSGVDRSGFPTGQSLQHVITTHLTCHCQVQQ